MLVAVVLRVARVDTRRIDSALFCVWIAWSLVRVLQVVLDIVLVALLWDVGLVDSGVVGKDHLIWATG